MFTVCKKLTHLLLISQYSSKYDIITNAQRLVKLCNIKHSATPRINQTINDNVYV